MSVVESSFSFSTPTKKHQKHSEAIDFTVDKSSLKEVEKKKQTKKKAIRSKKKKKKKQTKKKGIRFKKKKRNLSSKLNPVSLLLTMHLTKTLINHL